MSGVVTATRYVLDTSALLTLHNEERGSDRVAAILVAAAQGTAEVYGCFITLMEVFYRVWKNENQRAGRAAYVQCQQLPITWVHESPALLERAAGIKAVHALSLADAWIAATAIECEATEPPRYLRRLHSLRGLSHEEVTEVFTRSPRACSAHGA